jgi:hypothetical protein
MIAPLEKWISGGVFVFLSARRVRADLLAEFEELIEPLS